MDQAVGAHGNNLDSKLLNRVFITNRKKLLWFVCSGGEVRSKKHPVNPYRSKVGLNSTAFSAVQSRMSSSNRHLLFYSDFSLSFCYQVSAFKIWRLEIFWKINVDQAVGTHGNNLDCKVLNRVFITNRKKLLWLLRLV